LHVLGRIVGGDALVRPVNLPGQQPLSELEVCVGFVLNETRLEMARKRELDHVMTRVRAHLQVDHPRVLRIMGKGQKQGKNKDNRLCVIEPSLAAAHVGRENSSNQGFKIIAAATLVRLAMDIGVGSGSGDKP
jgi:hypothetical protein